MAHRHIIIGDIHGMREELERVLERVGLLKGDQVISLGDVLDRGPDSVGVVDLFCRLQSDGHDVVLVKGNHEEKHERFRAAYARAGDKVKMRDVERLKEITLALEPDHVRLLESAVMFHPIPEHNALVVHAGVLDWMKHLPADAEWHTMNGKEKARWSQMLRVRHVRSTGEVRMHVDIKAAGNSDDDWETGSTIDLGGAIQRLGPDAEVIVHQVKTKHVGDFIPLGQNGPGDPFWAETYDGRFGHIYFGHEPFMDGIRKFPHATGIDTGAVYGGELTAVVLEIGQEPRFVSMPAGRAWSRVHRED